MFRAAILFVFLLTPVLGRAAESESPKAIYRAATLPIQFDVSPPLRSITPLPIVPYPGLRELRELGTGNEGRLGPKEGDAAVQSSKRSDGPDVPSPGVTFNGPSNLSGVSPPDPVGDVGPNHYVAMSNLSFQIFNKAGTSLFGPALNNTLWAGFGGDCQTDNNGDPIVIHDQFADRWILIQFTASGPTFFICIAVSATPDPTGTYFRYALDTGGNFPDYPKLGMGANAYYFSTREFSGTTGPFVGVGAYAINRTQLLAGNPTPQVISFLVPPGATPYNIGDGLLPADIDGSTPPPVGHPHYFVGTMDNGGPYGAPSDAITLWKFVANFASPPSSTFTLANTLPVAAFDSIFPCSPGSRDCIPQAGTAQKIDILSYRQRAMHRLAYRNFGTHESLVTNQSVEAGAGIAGLRWYEIRSPNSSPVIHQQSTYAPGLTDGIHRWMGSIAMDASGNMALGFSASNASMFPSVWYTGRLAGDPLGTMPQGEAAIVNGTGSQTGSPRWGDYTSMNVDPSDDCTFWYVNQHTPVTGSNWRLRIGSFKFPSCVPPPAIVSRYPDFNDDGKSDLSWRNTSSGATSLWLMNGTTFLSAADILADPNWSVTNRGDLNGDGKTDLVWRNSATGATAAWLQDGLTMTSSATLLSIPSWVVTRVADISGDGKGDLLWRNSATGETAAWIMNGLAMTSSAILINDPNWVVLKTGDFNGDGSQDLLLRNSVSGAIGIWLMNGLTPTSSATILSAPPWTVTHVADFNGDGKDDLLWRNPANGQTAIWLMNGLASTSTAVIFTSLSWAVTHVGDFDGDGLDDLLWRNSSTGQTAVWLMNGLSMSSSAVVLSDPYWVVTQVGDTNGDGKSDLLWRNSATGATEVWLMNGLTYSASASLLTDPNWILSPPDGF